MKKETFDTLLELLRADVTLDKKQSCCSTSGNDPICPEVVVASGLRFMMGAHCADIVSMFFISCESARRIVEKFLDAVEKCLQLAIIPPTSLVELKGLENGSDKVSSANGIFKGVVGALDGWLCCINKPSEPNPTVFFSGHYQRFGINCQAVCDANLRFIYFGVISLGRTNDARSFNRALGLRIWLDNLPTGYFLVADNAYQLSDKMLIPFSGSQKERPYNRTYNFYRRQQRLFMSLPFCTISLLTNSK